MDEHFVEEIFDGAHRRVGLYHEPMVKEAIGLPQALAPAAVGLSLMAPMMGLQPDQAQAAPDRRAPITQQQQAPQQREMPVQFMNQIASFYAGKPVQVVGFDWTNTNGTTGMPGSSEIRLNPNVKKSLDALATYGPKSQQGMVLGALGLSVLIHESLHCRASQGDFQNDNEVMEGDLGVRMMPDAVQRFFGVPMDSPWGQKWMAMTMKSLG